MYNICMWLIKHNRFILFLSATLLVLCCAGCGLKSVVYAPATVMMPNTSPDMNIAGFWITKRPNPNKIILTPQEIAAFNAAIIDELGVNKDLVKGSPLFSKTQTHMNLKDSITSLKKKKMYLLDGKTPRKDFLFEIEYNMHYNDIFYDGVYRFALVTAPANQRTVPTTAALFTSEKNKEIDKVQNCALDIGTPLGVMHETLDKKWYYVTSPCSSGWVETEKIILCEQKGIKEYYKDQPFAVVTKAKAELYYDPELTKYMGFVRMGTRLPLFSKPKDGVAKVLVPYNNKGELSFALMYAEESKIHEGYLPYTPAVIIRQAFEFINAPYGWGGLYGEQDCSQFIQQIFATVGLQLPRNSASQARVGKALVSFDKKTVEPERERMIVEKGTGGTTVLGMDGHIMLYVGSHEGKPYAIHAIWAYTEDSLNTKTLTMIKRVVVSDLSLGKDSDTGSLLKRITEAREYSRD